MCNWYRFLVDECVAMQNIRGQRTWKAVIEGSENRAQITNTLKGIEAQTDAFQVSAVVSHFDHDSN
jgi:hypothetical protein